MQNKSFFRIKCPSIFTTCDKSSSNRLGIDVIIRKKKLSIILRQPIKGFNAISAHNLVQHGG